ncbi:hypothetical protein LTY36_07895 [Limosilactobacillus agrestis]|uniref:Uncharacterized protein n=1 Tax=Limosilactobacillus agrestis TaxID=2759748 RepID=A0A7W3YKW9_9LACO|nr:hypothetical protein [Limosilactobacillus agrestis]MBB1095478.1 hypothetical protein [Limosilactobacillus agrestis]MCD7131108.1 hypothetical protein [Limosilactobacillus agrestis]
MSPNILLWIIAILCVIATVLSIPSQKQLNYYKDQLRITNNQINKVEQHEANKLSINDSFNYYSAEITASKKLQEGLSKVVGGIHSNDDWNANKAQIEEDLGPKLAEQLKVYNVDPNTKEWLLKENNGVEIGYGKVKVNNQVPVIAVVSFKTMDNQSAVYLIKMNYDLKNEKVLNYQKIKPVTKQVMNVEGGD